MSLLTTEQKSRALEVMRQYLAAPAIPNSPSPVEHNADLDRNRLRLIESDLKPLVEDYLAGRVALADFKSRNDGLNKRNTFWGFKGIKGQMFFNMVVNVSPDEESCDQELKTAFVAPVNDDMARSRIKTFHSYVRRVGDDYVEAGGSKHRRPKTGSIPFFLSYFWQIQDRAKWPVYYTNSVNTMIDLNLWQPTEELADDYIAFKRIHEELAELFTRESGKVFDLYGVEHVFWFMGGNPYDAARVGETEADATEVVPEAAPQGEQGTLARLPDSYVPPIVAILPRIARNEEGLEAAAKASGTSLIRAFEKSIHAAFTILGYDTKLLGQGAGRVPDGLALDQDSSYALMWDAKIRADGYSMGTDDRTIREYVGVRDKSESRSKAATIIPEYLLRDHFKLLQG